MNLGVDIPDVVADISSGIVGAPIAAGIAGLKSMFGFYPGAEAAPEPAAVADAVAAGAASGRAGVRASTPTSDPGAPDASAPAPSPWPWVIGGVVVLGIAVFALTRRRR